jgi:Na+/phosphate symporter
VKEFLQVFGGFTIADAVVFIIAIGFIITTYFKLKKYIEIQYQGKQDKIEDNKKMKEELKRVGEEVDKYPQYRQQSINIQEELKANDAKLLETCVKIQQGVDRNQELLNERLDKLEDREKNSLKAKILDMHRLFTSKKKNPMQAWTEMERDAFFDLLKDYESLNGNGYVHTVVVPDMNLLTVISMKDTQTLAELFHSREA